MRLALWSLSGSLLLSACIAASPGSNSAQSAPAPAGGTTEAAAPSAASASTTNAKKHLVGYFTNWSQYRKGCKFTASDVNPELLTHLNFAFAKIDPGDRKKPTFKIAPYESNDPG